MDIEKYKNDGWGLSRIGFQKILEILEGFDNTGVKIIEFGSGKSTEFFDDYITETDKNITVVSYDDNIEYAYKPSINDRVEVKLRNLVECTDVTFNEIFNKKTIEESSFHPKKTPLTTRQKNNFYDISSDEIVGMYDLVVLDGPNGNGRSIAFLHLIDHLKNGSFVFIDDYTDYDFVERFNQLFDYEVYYETKSGMVDQWNKGGNFIILKVINNENI